MYGPGGSLAITKSPAGVEREVADQDAGLGIEGDDVRAASRPGRSWSRGRRCRRCRASAGAGYRSEMPAMSSACSTRSAMAPAVIAIGNITAPLPITRRLPLLLRSVSPIAEWPSPSRCPSSCSATDSRSTRSAWPFGATENAKRLLKKMSASTISPVVGVDQEAGRAEHAIEIGAIDEAERRLAVDRLRPAPTSCPGTRTGRSRRSTPDHVAVARSDRAPQIGRRSRRCPARSEMKYPIGCCFQVASTTWPFTLAPSFRYASAMRRASRSSAKATPRSSRDASRRHRGARASARARRASKAASDTGLRRGSPRTIRAGASTTGGTTSISPDARRAARDRCPA